MDELVTWLRAQLDEDERAALRATAGPWWRGEKGAWGDEEVILAGRGDVRPACVAALGEFGDSQSAFDAEHIARWHPARVLAEVDAKRRIVDVPAPGSQDPDPYVVKLLALPYADRTGYCDEWRP